MTLTTLIAVNAIPAAAVVLTLSAIVRFTHRLDDHAQPETLHPSQPIPIGLALPPEEVEELAEAA